MWWTHYVEFIYNVNISHGLLCLVCVFSWVLLNGGIPLALHRPSLCFKHSQRWMAVMLVAELRAPTRYSTWQVYISLHIKLYIFSPHTTTVWGHVRAVLFWRSIIIPEICWFCSWDQSPECSTAAFDRKSLASLFRDLANWTGHWIWEDLGQTHHTTHSPQLFPAVTSAAVECSSFCSWTFITCPSEQPFPAPVSIF